MDVHKQASNFGLLRGPGPALFLPLFSTGKMEIRIPIAGV